MNIPDASSRNTKLIDWRASPGTFALKAAPVLVFIFFHAVNHAENP
jgi:hypothetical protein